MAMAQRRLSFMESATVVISVASLIQVAMSQTTGLSPTMSSESDSNPDMSSTAVATSNINATPTASSCLILTLSVSCGMSTTPSTPVPTSSSAVTMSDTSSTPVLTSSSAVTMSDTSSTPVLTSSSAVTMSDTSSTPVPTSNPTTSTSALPSTPVSLSTPSPIATAVPMPPLTACPEETDPDWGYTWNTTPGGTQVMQSCSEDVNTTIGYVTRQCSNTGEWLSVDVSKCESFLVNSSTDQILAITQNTNVATADVEMLRSANAQLNEATGGTLFPMDLEDINRALQAEASLGVLGLEDNIVSVETFLNISSNILEDRNMQAWGVLVNTSSEEGPSSLLESVEQFIVNVGQFVASGQQGEETQITSNIVLNVNTVNFSETVSDVTIDISNLVTDMSSVQRMQAPSITIPGEFLAERFASLGQAQSLPITTVIIRNLQNYLPAATLNMTRTAGSLILVSQVGTDSEDGFSDQLLIRPVTIRFPVIVESGRNPLCVFWNFTLNSWSDVGLSEGRVVESQSGVSEVHCLSTHLTSFAVLMDVSGSLPSSVALSVLSYIGCGISIVCLILTMIFLVTLKRELYRQMNYFVLLNLCLALTCGMVIFCAGIETATPNLVACSFVAALLHYFFLAAFSWMLCQAVVIYNLLVRVYGAHKRPWLYLYLALGWGIPVPIVAISIGIRYDYYHIRGSLEPSDPAYHTTRACWLSSEFGVIFAFVAPMLAIVLVNTILLGLSLRSLWKSNLGHNVQNMDNKEQSNPVKLARKLMKATVILLPVLGLTWVFGLLSAIPIPSPGQTILSSFFLILNTLQGVFIFWFHVVRSERVWGWLSKKCSTTKWRSGKTKSSNISTTADKVGTIDSPKLGIPLSNYEMDGAPLCFPQDNTSEVDCAKDAETSLAS